MINWIINKLDLVTHHRYAMIAMNKKINNLVDRLTQLEQTVQCLSDDNQQLIAKLYSKKGE